MIGSDECFEKGALQKMVTSHKKPELVCFKDQLTACPLGWKLPSTLTLHMLVETTLPPCVDGHVRGCITSSEVFLHKSRTIHLCFCL